MPEKKTAEAKAAEPKKAAAKKTETKKTETKKPEAKKTETKKTEAKADTKKAEPKKAEPKAEAKKAEPKKAEPKPKEEPKAEASKDTRFLMYKGHPLVRSGNMLYYGAMNEDCVIMIQILSTKTVGNMTIADQVQVQLVSTDPEVSMKDRVLKTSKKQGLFNAMDIGAIWLERELNKG